MSFLIFEKIRLKQVTKTLRKTYDLSKSLVFKSEYDYKVKLIRAHGGCLGTRSR